MTEYPFIFANAFENQQHIITHRDTEWYFGGQRTFPLPFSWAFMRSRELAFGEGPFLVKCDLDGLSAVPCSFHSYQTHTLSVPSIARLDGALSMGWCIVLGLKSESTIGSAVLPLEGFDLTYFSGYNGRTCNHAHILFVLVDEGGDLRPRCFRWLTVHQ